MYNELLLEYCASGDVINIGHINVNSVQEVCPLSVPEEISLAELDAISNTDGVSFTTHKLFIITDVDCGQICLCYEYHHGDDKSRLNGLVHEMFTTMVTISTK